MEKVFKARKNNRVLRIPESRIKEYSELGYTIKDGEGNIIFEPENKAKKIADLEAENADLKAKRSSKRLRNMLRMQIRRSRIWRRRSPT